MVSGVEWCGEMLGRVLGIVLWRLIGRAHLGIVLCLLLVSTRWSFYVCFVAFVWRCIRISAVECVAVPLRVCGQSHFLLS